MDNSTNAILETSLIYGVGTAPEIAFVPGAPVTLPITGLNAPLALTVDAAGDVFVGDTGNRVLEPPAGGSLTTVPFTGIGRPFGVWSWMVRGMSLWPITTIGR